MKEYNIEWVNPLTGKEEFIGMVLGYNATDAIENCFDEYDMQTILPHSFTFYDFLVTCLYNGVTISFKVRF